ncbi:hypothetical protein EMPS_07201 [Entomortierella parvispora]|uniref:C2 domain-containing protein n=1 Tax=Entomortierella parvispora TaxID=205924 RepID=A0A9P3LY80_9FUNG|nr:hypothetical protein EMPS_07201 [Entomortierella parvispora]
MASTQRKLGVLVAIPIKGRKLVNKSGGKLSPYVQLRLGDQNKRTRASLIAAVEPEWDQEIRLDVFQGQLDMRVAVRDEGKYGLIGEGILMLHEVIDKGELDVWFPIRLKGASTGDVYFELTFYAAAPPPGPGIAPSPLHQRPSLRYQMNQAPAGAGGRPLPNAPIAMHGRMNGPPAPYAGNIYQHPVGYSPGAIPYPVPGQHQPLSPQQQQMRPPMQMSYPQSKPPMTTAPPFGGPPSGPGFHPAVVAAATPTFRPTTQYSGGPSRPIQGGFVNSPPPFPTGPTTSSSHYPNSYPNNNPQRPSMPTSMPVPQPYNPNQGHGQAAHHGPGPGQRPPNAGYPMIHNRPGGVSTPQQMQQQQRPPITTAPMGPVTPMRQYNYTLGSFP